MGLALRWPVFWLTLRQFRAGKAVWVTAGFAALPILLAVLYRSGTSTESPNGFLAAIYQNLLGPTILPLGTLILATTALGNEIEDRTLVYLTLKPLARVRILIAKYLAAIAVGGSLFVLGAWATWLVAAVGRSDAPGWGSLLALVAAVVAGVIGYGALFLLISLIAPRALLIGIIYTLFWETTLARFIPALRYASVRYYAESLYARLLSDPALPTGDTARTITSVIVLAVLIVLALGLGTWRLYQMDLD